MKKPPKYKQFKKSLPENLAKGKERDYSMRRLWKDAGKPKDFNESLKQEDSPFQKVYHENEGKYFYHAPSASAKTGKFYKPKKHPTTYKEIGAFMENPESLKTTKLVSRGRYWKYKPKTEREIANPERTDKRTRKNIEKGLGKSMKSEIRLNKKNIKAESKFKKQR